MDIQVSPMFFVIGVVVAALLLVTTFIAFWVISLRRVVPTNMVHIVQTARQTVSYGKGRAEGNTYYEFPVWMPIIGIEVSQFPESIFEIALTDYEAYDSDRLPFMVDIRAFFRIEDSNAAAQRVSSFTELRQQLQAVLQGSVRRVLATGHLETIMQDRSDLGDKFTQEVREQLQEWGVTPVKTIEFMDIRDSRGTTVIANIMAKKISVIDKESRIEVADNRKVAETREIEAKQEVDVKRQDAERIVGERTAEKEKAVGIAGEKARQDVAVEARTTAERDMAVKQVNDVRTAEIKKEVAVVNSEQEKQVKIINAEAAQRETIIKAEADKAQTVISADATKAQTETIAQGNLTQDQLKATGIESIGKAEAEALRLRELAPISANIELAKEIGQNDGYQKYLVSIRQIEASQQVGTHMAQAIGKADLKVITNAGDPQTGVAKIGDLFTTQGGQGLTGMLAALGNTPAGAALVERLTGVQAVAEEEQKKAGKGGKASNA